LNKLKWGLRSITICCILIPLLFTALTYQTNLVGLIVPPEIQDLLQNGGSGQGDQGGSGMDSIATLLGIDMENFTAPQIVQEPTFNNETGEMTMVFNFTNPMTENDLAINSMSVDVTDSNGNVLMTVNLDQAVIIAAGQTGNLPISGQLTEQAMAMLQSQGGDMENFDFSSLTFSNFNADIGGIVIHLDNLNELMDNSGGM
jgi:hypothetical protein